MLESLREKAHELRQVFAPNKEIVTEFLSMMGEEKSWKEWQRRFPGMLPESEPCPGENTWAQDIDFDLGEYHMTGRIEREGQDKWQLVRAGAEEG